MRKPKLTYTLVINGLEKHEYKIDWENKKIYLASKEALQRFLEANPTARRVSEQVAIFGSKKNKFYFIVREDLFWKGEDLSELQL